MYFAFSTESKAKHKGNKQKMLSPDYSNGNRYIKNSKKQKDRDNKNKIENKAQTQKQLILLPTQ